MTRFLRIGQVVEITGLSRSTIYALPDFPKPRKLGPRASGWVASEIEKWAEEKASSREAANA